MTDRIVHVLEADDRIVWDTVSADRIVWVYIAASEGICFHNEAIVWPRVDDPSILKSRAIAESMDFGLVDLESLASGSLIADAIRTSSGIDEGLTQSAGIDDRIRQSAIESATMVGGTFDNAAITESMAIDNGLTGGTFTSTALATPSFTGEDIETC